jgi:DNA adenine methylase
MRRGRSDCRGSAANAVWSISGFPGFPAYLQCRGLCGSRGAVFHAPPAEVEVLNDVNDDLTNLYRVVQHHPEAFISQFTWTMSSRQVFKWLNDIPPESLTDIQHAARFYYLQQNCFGGRIEGRTLGSRTRSASELNVWRLKEILSTARRRLSRAYIEKLGWPVCISRYDQPYTFFYLDPPCWQSPGYGGPFSFEQHKRMASVIRAIEGRAIVTVNDQTCGKYLRGWILSVSKSSTRSAAQRTLDRVGN